MPKNTQDPRLLAASERRLKQLLKSSKLAVLATHKNGQPYCSLVAFSHTRDLKYIIFATCRSTRKYENLSADKRVSMLVDSRTNREADFHKAEAVTITGKATEVSKQIRNKYLRIYLRKHPELKGFVCSPNCALLRIKVDRYYLVSRFQEVMEIRPCRRR
jgi:nitroimidazol reductase NimA-like FMN-containing flavoprotein (pyridoxamine 5'-phosphate oxidase superfamily)